MLLMFRLMLLIVSCEESTAMYLHGAYGREHGRSAQVVRPPESDACGGIARLAQHGHSRVDDDEDQERKAQDGEPRAGRAGVELLHGLRTGRKEACS